MEGQAVFVCPECKEHFKSANIDYRSTTEAIPMICPKCGTRTRDRYWNQTDLSDAGLIIVSILILLSPLIIWKTITFSLRLYYRRLGRRIYKEEQEANKNNTN